MNVTWVQYEALKRIRDKGPDAWCQGGRAGGATGRMFDRMAKAGWCTEPPHRITDKGRYLLERLDAVSKPVEPKK